MEVRNVEKAQIPKKTKSIDVFGSVAKNGNFSKNIKERYSVKSCEKNSTTRNGKKE